MASDSQRCFNVDLKVVEALGYKQIINKKYILNVFLTDWFNLPIQRGKEVAGTLYGYVYHLKDLREALQRKDWREAYRIIATTAANMVKFYKNVKRVIDAYNNIELLETGLFKVYIDPYLPLGFYIAIGKLLHKPLLLRGQKLYIAKYINILEKRMVIPQIPEVEEPETGGIIQSVTQKAKKTFKDLAKEAYKQFVEHNIKEYVEKTIGIQPPPDDEDIAAFIKSVIGITKQPLGIVKNAIYSVIGSSSLNINRFPGQPEINLSSPPGINLGNQSTSITSGLLTNIPQPNQIQSALSGKTSELFDKSEAANILGGVASYLSELYQYTNINISLYYWDYLNAWSDFGLNVGLKQYIGSAPQDTLKVNLYHMMIVPLNVFVYNYSGRETGPLYYLSVYKAKSLYKEREILGIETDQEEYQVLKPSEIYKELVLDRAAYYKTAADAAAYYIQALIESSSGAESENQNITEEKYTSFLNVLAASIIPIDEHKLDYDRLKAIMNSKDDWLGIATTTIIGPESAKSTFSLESLSDVLDLSLYFLTKSIEATRNYLSESILGIGDYVVASLEPFSNYFPPLPPVYSIKWVDEINQRYSAIHGVRLDIIEKANLPVPPELKIYSDILPLNEFSLIYDDIETENVTPYNVVRSEIPTSANNTVPAIKMSIYDTAERHLTNYFKAYRKTAFYKSGVRPPLDICFILDVMRIRADFGVQDLLSFLVLPKSLTLPPFEYNASEDFLDKGPPLVEIEWAVIGFITYTGASPGFVTTTAEDGSITVSPAGGINGMMNIIKGTYEPSRLDPKDLKSVNEKVAVDVLRHWYSMYTDLPGFVEMHGRQPSHWIEVNSTAEKQRINQFSAPRTLGIIDKTARKRLIEKIAKNKL